MSMDFRALLFALPLAASAIVVSAMGGGSERLPQVNAGAVEASRARAATAAGRETGGRVVEVKFGTGRDAGRIVVQTDGPRGLQTVHVDRDTGQITGIYEGKDVD